MTAHHPYTDAELDARYAGIFKRIAAGALARERQRELLHEPVAWLKEAGFTALRVPREYGGSGVTLPQLFRQLIRLAQADSNLPQLLRSQFRFTEVRIQGDKLLRDRWFPRLAAGETVGSATSERTAVTGNSVTLDPDPDGKGFRLNGEKYYCTGTLYADWVSVKAHDDASDIEVLVRTDAEGVTCLDDWDGFGQRMTGSGTTRFDNVYVSADQIISRFDGTKPRLNTLQPAFVQTVLLATLAGIARAVLDDSIAYVLRRTRTVGIQGQSQPRENPLVQRVIGRISSLAFSAESLVLNIAGVLENLQAARAAGTARSEDYAAAQNQAFQAQQIVVQQVLEATTLLFEVGGASATSETLGFDRHWRNARVVASHNPAAQREAAIGRYLLDGVLSEKGSVPDAVPVLAAQADEAAALLAQ